MGFEFRGNLIINVNRNGQAKEAGVCCGWKILKVNGVQQSNNMRAIDKAIEKTYSRDEPTEILFSTTVSTKYDRFKETEHSTEEKEEKEEKGEEERKRSKRETSKKLLKKNDNNTSRQVSRTELLNKVVTLRNLIRNAYQTGYKYAIYIFWERLVKNIEAFLNNQDAFDKNIAALGNELFLTFQISLNGAKEIWKESKFIMLNKQVLINKEANLTADFYAISEIRNQQEKLCDLLLWQTKSKHEKEKKEQLPPPALGALFWPRMFNNRVAIHWKEFANAIYLYLNIVYNQRIQVSETIFEKMIQNTMNMATNENVTPSSWYKFIERFGPRLAMVYSHLKGVTLSDSGDLSPWISFSLTESEAESKIHDIKSRNTNSVTRFLVRPCEQEKGFIVYFWKRTKSKVLQPTNTRITLENEGYIVNQGNKHHKTLRELLIALNTGDTWVKQQIKFLIDERLQWTTNKSNMEKLTSFFQTKSKS